MAITTDGLALPVAPVVARQRHVSAVAEDICVLSLGLPLRGIAALDPRSREEVLVTSSGTCTFSLLSCVLDRAVLDEF